jgi:hypothetical protein
VLHFIKQATFFFTVPESNRQNVPETGYKYLPIWMIGSFAVHNLAGQIVENSLWITVDPAFNGCIYFPSTWTVYV